MNILADSTQFVTADARAYLSPNMHRYESFLFGFLVIYWWWNFFLSCSSLFSVVELKASSPVVSLYSEAGSGPEGDKGTKPPEATLWKAFKQSSVWLFGTRDTNAGQSRCSPSKSIFLMRADNWGITNSKWKKVNNNNTATIFQCQANSSPDSHIATRKRACCSEMNKTHFTGAEKSKSKKAWEMWMNDLIGTAVEAVE